MATQTITVSNASELKQALTNATGGETILLAAGNYGRLDLRSTQFTSEVTIKSADANAMASFSELRLDQVSNLTFDAVVFDYNFSAGDYHFQSPFKVNNSTNVAFNNSVFDGDVASGTGTSADGKGYGTGLYVTNSSNIDVTGTEFSKWWKGFITYNSDGINVIGNDIHSIRSDGLVFDNVDNILIENNYIHDFGGAAGSGDHRDMIQIQRAYGSGSDNITIRDNVFDMGQGDYTQTIWMGGDGKNISDPNVMHHNVLIEGNVIYNGHFHGVSIYGVDGLTVTENTILHVDAAQLTGGVEIPVINISSGSKNVTIDYNVASQILGYNGQSDWNVSNNATIQPNQYSQMFTYLATAQTDGYNQYGVKPGSLVDTLNAGSDLVDSYPFSYDTWVGTATSSGTGTTGSTGTTGTSGTGTTGTSGTGTTGTSGTGTTGTSGTGTTGTSGTGTTGTSGTGTTDTSGTGTTGTSGTGTTDTSGTGTTGTSGTGTTDTSGTGTSGTGTANPMVFDDYVLDIANLADGTAKAWKTGLKGDAVVVDTAQGPVVQLDGNDDWVKIGRRKEFEDSDQLAFSVDFTSDPNATGPQKLVWNHMKFGLSLTKDGGLSALVDSNGKKFHQGFKFDNLDLNDGNKHNITLMVDQVDDHLQILVDDVLVLDDTSRDFDFTGGREWGWSLGTAWSGDFDGEISYFAIDDDVQFVDTTANDLFG